MRRRLWIMAWLVAACNPVSVTLVPASPFTAAPTLVPADTGWHSASAGIETRELDVAYQGRRDRLFLARVDPGLVSFHVRYTPGQTRRVSEWLEAEQARLVINAGFFDPDKRALGLLVSDRQAFGESYRGLGGLFGVGDGRVQVRSLILQPYSPTEAFDQMAQSFPMLLNGGSVNGEIRDDGDVAARSLVGLDRNGRVVFLVSPRSTFNLTDLAAWLAGSDLDLEAALNLDGGTSSGLMARTAQGRWGVDSWIGVPAVIAVK